MKTIKCLKFIFLLIIPFMSWSCIKQKEIQIDLNSTNPLIVIEALLSDLPGGAYVRLSQTVNYYSPDSFPPVTGATVKITDDAGNIVNYEMEPGNPGFYLPKKVPFLGIPEKKYTLSVIANGIEYISESTMPKPVKIDSLEVTIEIRNRRGNPFGRQVSGKTSDTTYRVNINFRDPAGENNFYRFVEIYKVPLSSVTVTSDRFRDGKEIQRELAIDTTSHVKKGDSVTVEMQSIDQRTYDFFRTFRSTLGRGGLGFLSASPGNPISNFTNGAMGYFSAYSTNRKSVIIP